MTKNKALKYKDGIFKSSPKIPVLESLEILQTYSN